jgi:hypothetical protein
MKARRVVVSIVMTVVLALSAQAGAKNDIQKYFNDAANKVKATDNPVEKRAILTTSFQTMTNALDVVRRSPLTSQNDIAGIDRIKTMLQEKKDELAGANGYEAVPDVQLNAFSNYVVQDMEQADQMISISIVTLLLILILVVLIL